MGIETLFSDSVIPGFSYTIQIFIIVPENGWNMMGKTKFGRITYLYNITFHSEYNFDNDLE